MSRVGILGLMSVVVVAAYLVGRYQETGELFQINWRTSAKKTGANTNSVTSPVTSLNSLENSIEESEASNEVAQVHPVNANSVSTNRTQKPVDGKQVPAPSGQRVDEWQKRKVLVPTNAVWSPTSPRKNPGVRMAFP